jgi:hypothetical protein
MSVGIIEAIEEDFRHRFPGYHKSRGAERGYKHSCITVHPLSDEVMRSCSSSFLSGWRQANPPQP